MKQPTSVLEFPVVLRKHLTFMTISIPDLGITLVEELSANKKLKRDEVTKIVTLKKNPYPPVIISDIGL